MRYIQNHGGTKACVNSSIERLLFAMINDRGDIEVLHIQD